MVNYLSITCNLISQYWLCLNDTLIISNLIIQQIYNVGIINQSKMAAFKDDVDIYLAIDGSIREISSMLWLVVDDENNFCFLDTSSDW